MDVIQDLREDLKKEQRNAIKRQLIENGSFVRLLSVKAAWFVRPLCEALWRMAADTALPNQTTEQRLLEIFKMAMWKG